MRNFFKRFFGGKQKSFVFTTANIANNTANGRRINTEGTINSAFTSIDDLIVNVDSRGEKVVEDARKVIEPKAVFEEIKRETPEISFDNLDGKIESVKGRIDILKEHLDEEHLKDEHRTLFYLKNRKKYLKTRHKYPLDWAMTTREAVDDLCKNYKLKVVPLKQYYTLVPNLGLKEMRRYTEAYKKITGDEPIFELVIKDVPATKKKDRDPILIANSPLGNFMFVIGAWDDEVEVVDEIIYGMR